MFEDMLAVTLPGRRTFLCYENATRQGVAQGRTSEGRIMDHHDSCRRPTRGVRSPPQMMTPNVAPNVHRTGEFSRTRRIHDEQVDPLTVDAIG